MGRSNPKAHEGQPSFGLIAAEPLLEWGRCPKPPGLPIITNVDCQGCAVHCTMNSHIGGLTRLLGLIHKHKMDSLKKRPLATASYFVEKGAESNGHAAGLIVLEELRASLISDIKVSGLVMVTPKQARKLTQDLLQGICEQGLHISREFLQGQVGLSHKQGSEAQHSSKQNEGSTGTVSLTSAKESLDAEGDALGRKGMEHAKQDAHHEVPIRTDAQPKHIEEEGGATLQKATPALRMFSLPRAGQSFSMGHQGLPYGEVSSDRTK